MTRLVSKKSNATSDVNFFANNGSHKTSFMPKVTAVGTIEPNRVRRWWSSFLLLGIVFSVLGFGASSLFAKTSDRYQVEVTYVNCYDANGNVVGESRTETWKKGGHIVYEEHTNCYGETTSSGKKPIVAGSGLELWDLAATHAEALSIGRAEALAMDFPPIKDTTEEDTRTIIFDFPSKWLSTRYKVVHLDNISATDEISADWFIDAKADLKLNVNKLPNVTNIFIIDSITYEGDTLGRGFMNCNVTYDMVDAEELVFDRYFCNGTSPITDYQTWLTTCQASDTSKHYKLAAFDSNINTNISPNPASGNTTFSIDLQATSNLHIVVVDINGNEILLLHNARTVAGAFSKTFSVANLAKGSYFVKCEIDERTVTVPFVVSE